MHKLVQIVRFESARKLPKVPEDHPCGNVYGLAFKLEVHVEGKVDPETGFVIDFGHIESAIKPTYDLIDHNYLNDIKGLENPTSEVLVEWIWNNLYRHFNNEWNFDKNHNKICNLVKLVLWENEVSRVEFKGN
ncbi:MAG: hypothetical protein CMA20_00300 [Euryarchaeota archaeon]|jgi:6-pyruvoyltetrahydropterin/6-carboxytetrahydropterin synthase|nr:hypothetical protein [Euryarchaeota archaeon]|tara:strand:+ start:390 stop:788 length:399 start_codon:yes stop_codon:yes gene_type:complete